MEASEIKIVIKELEKLKEKSFDFEVDSWGSDNLYDIISVADVDKRIKQLKTKIKWTNQDY